MSSRGARGFRWTADGSQVLGAPVLVTADTERPRGKCRVGQAGWGAAWGRDGKFLLPGVLIALRPHEEEHREHRVS